MSTGKFLAGFIVGGVVGAVMGLLLAPQSGEETREMLARNSEELKNKAPLIPSISKSVFKESRTILSSSTITISILFS